MKKLMLLIIGIMVVWSNYAQKSISGMFPDEKVPNQTNHFPLTKRNFEQITQNALNDSLWINPIERLIMERGESLRSVEEIILKQDSFVVHRYDAALNEWIKTGRYKHTIEEVEDTVKHIICAWNDTTNEWICCPYHIWEYNGDGSLLHEIYNSFHLYGTVISVYHKTDDQYTYENDGIQEEITKYQQQYGTNDLIPYSKEEKHYNSNEDLTFYKTFYWNSDSLDWIQQEKNEYGYDEFGNQNFIMSLIWNEYLSSWKGVKKEEYVFDEAGNKISEIIYWWDFDSEDFILMNKQEYIYNNEGEITQKIGSVWNSTENSWIYDNKEEHAFDANSNQTLRSYYNWDKDLNQWIGLEKFENGYNEIGNLLFESNYTWDSELNDWKGDKKTVYSYNDKGNQILVTLYSWETELTEWVFDSEKSKYEYEYNESGKVVLKISYTWSNEQWAKSSKHEYAYDAMGRKILVQSSGWISDSIEWRYSTKKEFAFNKDGKYLLEANYNWDVEKQEWVLLYKYEQDYDENGRTTLSSSLRFYFEGYYEGRKHVYIFDDNGMQTLSGFYYWNNDLDQWVGTSRQEISYIVMNKPLVQTYFRWDLNSNDWIYSERYIYYYTEEVVQSSPNISDESSVTVYPNPASEYLLVDISGRNYEMQFELYDFNGKKVRSGNLSHGNRLSVENLTSGVYIWKIIQETEVSTGKIIIE